MIITIMIVLISILIAGCSVQDSKSIPQNNVEITPVADEATEEPAAAEPEEKVREAPEVSRNLETSAGHTGGSLDASKTRDWHRTRKGREATT